MPNHLHAAERFLLAMDAIPFERENGGSNNNNNNHHALWMVRDRLFQVLFEKITVAYASTFGDILRKLIEIIILSFALMSLGILFYIHFAFVRAPVTCLEKETSTWSRQGVLRVEISLEEPVSLPVDASRYCNKTPIKNNRKIIQEQTHAFLMAQTKLNAESAGQTSEVEDEEDHILDAEKSPEFINRTGPYKDSVFDPDCLSPVTTTLSESEIYTANVEPVEEKYAIEYSLEYGFLRLSAATRQKMGVEIHTVVLDPLKDKCFGSEFSQFLLKYILGYADLLMGSLRYLVEGDIDKGYVRNVITGDQYRFVDKTATWTAYINALVVMIVCTLAVSMLLRYSHHQIFLFVVELFHTLELNSSLNFPVTQIFTVILALVGMEAMMSEFFNDSITAFYIIIIVWIADQFDSICCHSSVSKKHWLKFFYLYHFAFYAYHCRFNGQYSALALITSWLFIQHSMLYFFHRYELPVVMARYEQQEEDYDSDTSYQSENYMPLPLSEENNQLSEQHEQSETAPSEVVSQEEPSVSLPNRNSGSNSNSNNRNRRRGSSKQVHSSTAEDRRPQIS